MSLEIDRIYQGDCLDLMREIPDKAIDLALTDPPYGIGMDGGCIGYPGANVFQKKGWDSSPPDQEYFDELFRISKNQAIFGGNYFKLPPTRGFLIWDKGAGFKGRSYAECEYIWTSFDTNAAIYRRDPLAHRDYAQKQHPTQKPLPVIEWILERCSEPGHIVLDPFLGSGTTAVACARLDRHYVGIEQDADYFEVAQARVREARGQSKLFGHIAEAAP